jgi:hypothetical protein
MCLYVRSTSQEGEWSCICMLKVQARRVSDHIQIHDHSLSWLGTGTLCTPNFQIYDHSLSWLVLLTYKYMTTHSPGLYS